MHQKPFWSSVSIIQLSDLKNVIPVNSHYSASVLIITHHHSQLTHRYVTKAEQPQREDSSAASPSCLNEDWHVCI